MRWVAKAAVQKVVSWSPASEKFNYLLQNRVMRHYPRSDKDFLHWIQIAGEHCEILRRYGPPRQLGEAAFYEFGTGWDLLIPLAFYTLGVNRQTLVDIVPHVRFDLVNNVLDRMWESRSEVEARLGQPVRVPAPEQLTRVEELGERFGIAYLAPRDARKTGLPAESFDFISSTATLEHIPESDIELIFAECGRLLRPGGLLSCRVDLTDHFAYFDSAISCYNFLKFSERVWSLIVSPLNFTNRLRRADYLRIAEGSGLNVVREQNDQPTEADLEALGGMKLSPRFRGRPLADLGVKYLRVVLQKPTGAPGDQATAREVGISSGA